MDWASVATTVGAFLTGLTGIVGFILGYRFLQLEHRHEREAGLVVAELQPTLEDKLDRLTSSMRDSARLVEEVTAELEARAATAQKLRQEADDAQALAAESSAQVDAVRRLLRAEMAEELAKTQRGVFRDSLKIAVGSFILGVAGTVGVTLLIH